MRIACYIQKKYAKQNYSNECFDTRVFAGLLVVKDILERCGYEVEYATSANVTDYDVVLVSITSDCDWWSFLSERLTWPSGRYKVIAGGAGVLNVLPFLGWVDYFVFGRAEGVIAELVDAIGRNGDIEHPSIAVSSRFDPKKEYYINQASVPYPHTIRLAGGRIYREGRIGCNYRCRFCAYSWHRKNTGGCFEYGDLWNHNRDVEVAMLDIVNGKRPVDYVRLRTTAIDGLSERLRFQVNKKISSKHLRLFLKNLVECEKPHQVKFYNIIGYPDETEEDWLEFLADIESVDRHFQKREKQTCILLHNTPFRPMPATPMACERASLRNYRGAIAGLRPDLKGNIFFQGNALWAVEGFGVESLSTVMLSMICLRGEEADRDGIERVCRSRRFWTSKSSVKEKTLLKYFDIDKLFGPMRPDQLATRYLRTYAPLRFHSTCQPDMEIACG